MHATPSPDDESRRNKVGVGPIIGWTTLRSMFGGTIFSGASESEDKMERGTSDAKFTPSGSRGSNSPSALGGTTLRVSLSRPILLHRVRDPEASAADQLGLHHPLLVGVKDDPTLLLQDKEQCQTGTIIEEVQRQWHNHHLPVCDP